MKNPAAHELSSDQTENVRLRQVRPDDADATALALELTEAGARVYADIDLPAAPNLEELIGPDDRLIVAYDGSSPIGMGAVRRLDDETAEIKRMYVSRNWRRQGVGRQLLERLETEARELGFERIRLDTGDRQEPALNLYRSAGYREIADYNGNPGAAYWFEKELSAQEPQAPETDS